MHIFFTLIGTFLFVLTVTAEQPNFLIILGDDISASSMGCYGSENPHTSPNIDQLAKEGIRFTNMFVSEAVCGPSRAELYTGLQPYRNGCMQNHKATRKGVLSVVQRLEKLGYRVGLTGKRHFRPTSVYPFEFVKGFPQNCNARETTNETWDGVEEFMTRDPDQPFCLIICSIHAHAPWDSGDTSYWELDELKLPPFLVDTEKTRYFYREYLAEVRLFDDQVGKARALLKEKQLDETTVLIVLDENGAGMPGGKWTNYDWGVRSACLIKWPGIEGASVTDALAQYCDILPTMIDAAGGEVPTDLDGKSLLPLIFGKADTLRDHAHFVYNSGPEGPPFSSRGVTDGRFKLMWNLTPDALFAVRVINGFDYGYEDKKDPNRHVRKIYLSWLEEAKSDGDAAALVQRYRKHPKFQLFDLEKDPWEMNNLADNPEYTAQLQRMKKSIVDWMKEQGDNTVFK
ncbi:MAG: sulfatase [Pontiella sp.]